MVVPQAAEVADALEGQSSAAGGDHDGQEDAGGTP